MSWVSIAFLALTCVLLWIALDKETGKRKKLETIVVKLRNNQRLNEQELVIYGNAKAYNMFGETINKA